MSRRLGLLAVLALGVMVSGCAVYGQQNYGPQNLSTKTLQECLTKAGGPDIMHKSGNNTVCIYKIIDGTQVLGIFGIIEKKDRVLVFDANGNLVSDDAVLKGKGMFILGCMSPIIEVE